MPVISLNDKRTDNERYKRTGKERKYHTAELFATGFTGVTDNLHQHWDFGNGSSYSGSGNTVTDLTGNAHNGVLEGSSNISFSSDNGGHITLSTTESSNNFPFLRRTTETFSDVGTGDFTLEFWVNIYHKATPSTGNNALLWRNTPNDSSPYLENTGLYIKDGKIRGSNWFFATGATTAGSWTDIDQSTNYTLNAYEGWEHLVFSRIGTGNNNMKFYNNNSLVHTWTNKASYDDNNSSSATSAMTTFGHNEAPGVRGKIAIYRFYLGKGLTSTEVTTNYNDQKSRFGF